MATDKPLALSAEHSKLLANLIQQSGFRCKSTKIFILPVWKHPEVCCGEIYCPLALLCRLGLDRVKVAGWGIKRMKTRWGTCNIRAKKIWLNLDLAQYPEPCLEYVVVHEMTHLLERLHNDRFKGILDRVCRIGDR